MWRCHSPCGGRGTGLVSTLPTGCPRLLSSVQVTPALLSSAASCDTHGPIPLLPRKSSSPHHPYLVTLWQSTPLSIVLQPLRAPESPRTLQLFMLESRKRSYTLQEEHSRDFTYVGHEWLPYVSPCVRTCSRVWRLSHEALHSREIVKLSPFCLVFSFPLCSWHHLEPDFKCSESAV